MPPDHSPSPIRIAGTPSSPPPGRRLLATATFPPGALIATFSAPLIVIPSGPTARSVCNRCLLAPASAAGQQQEIKACTGCRFVGYCSAACQKADWSKGLHKRECKAFKRVRSKVEQEWLPTGVRGLVQVLLRLKGEEEEEEGGGGETRRVLEGLEGNVEGFRQGRVWKDMEMQALAGVTYAGWEASEENLKLAVEILCKIQTNSFDRADPDIGQTGTFLDPTLAMVNHSCMPNAIVAFSGRKAFLRAEEEIKEGDEITISYIDYTKPKIFRQHGLELYHFECTCPRCTDDLDVYQAAQRSPLIPLNQPFSFLSHPITALRTPPIDAKLARDPAFRAQIDKIYVACSPESSRAAAADPAELGASLRQQWAHCAPLRRARAWAAEPLANVLQQAIGYFSARGRFMRTLAVECFVAARSDPYKFVAPFKQWRLKGLLMIAKTIPNTEMAAAGAGEAEHAGVAAVLARSDLGSLYQAILLMALRYGERAHSAEWAVLDGVREMLADIEGMEERRDASVILRRWVEDPENPVAERFFRERAVRPVEELADLAVGILEEEFGGEEGAVVVRR